VNCPASDLVKKSFQFNGFAETGGAQRQLPDLLDEADVRLRADG